MPTKDKVIVKDEAPEWNYWTRLPNIILEKIENPYQLALLFVYKKIARDDGLCWFTMENIAQMAKMSVGKASRTRRELEELGLIKVEFRKPQKSRGRPCCHVMVVDIWEENEAEWQKICAEKEGRLLPGEIFSSPPEEIGRISSPHEGYPSPHEATKNKEKESEDKNDDDVTMKIETLKAFGLQGRLLREIAKEQTIEWINWAMKKVSTAGGVVFLHRQGSKPGDDGKGPPRRKTAPLARRDPKGYSEYLRAFEPQGPLVEAVAEEAADA